MPSYQFTGGDSRDYFPAALGRVNPGDVRDVDSAPDANWVPVSAAPLPATVTMFPPLVIPPLPAA
jgi:hypothetical protein